MISTREADAYSDEQVSDDEAGAFTCTYDTRTRTMYVKGTRVPDEVFFDAPDFMREHFEQVNEAVSIIFSDEVQHIGYRACYGLPNLSQVVLSNSIESIGALCFACCPQLKKIVLPDSLRCIPYGLFVKCTELEVVELGRYTESIGTSAFSGCESLKQIKLPNTVRFIDELAFFRTGLETIVVPESVAVIKAACFSNCHSLREVVLQRGLDEIKMNAFRECSNLSTLYIPTSVRLIGRDVFLGCTSFKSISVARGTRFEQAWEFMETRNSFVPNCSIESYTLRESQEELDWLKPDIFVFMLCMHRVREGEGLTFSVPTLNLDVLYMIIHMYVQSWCDFLNRRIKKNLPTQCTFKYKYNMRLQ